MKRWLCIIGSVGICFISSVSAAPSEELKTSPDLPKEMNLIFSDRVIGLNFELQPELLQQTPHHFLKIGGKRYPMNLGDMLPESSNLLDIETTFETEISPTKLKEFLIGSAIIREEKDEFVEIQMTNVKDASGKERIIPVFEGRPRDGYDIDLDLLVRLINSAIRIGEDNIRVPAEKTFSKVVVSPELEERGVKEVIAIGESNFAGSSPARKQNITAAAKKFNGYFLPKGKTFSFNTILGDISERDGFVKELVIRGNDTEKELGGGTCQVSTTAFRAAFSGGLPIVTRREHSYAVPYYRPYGLDATIYLGGQDFRFRNDTPGDILIQTFKDGDNLFFIFYGTRDDRKVSFEGPFISEYRKAPEAKISYSDELPEGESEQVSPSHDGFRAEWVRRVQKDGNVEVENIISHYQAWAAKIMKGTGEKKDEEQNESKN